MSIPLTVTFGTRARLSHYLSVWQSSAFRHFASRRKCAPYDDPKCSKKTLAQQKPCPSKLRRIEAKEEIPKTNSLWENPECCKDPCPDYYPRFDELYYKTSDKLKRKYQQTWVSCPKLRIKPKKICSSEELIFPPIERRPRKNVPLTACPIGGSRICMDKRMRKCPRTLMPSCRGARIPPKCKTERLPGNCLKECTPYPSYSECLRKDRDAPSPIECDCLNNPMMCEVWCEMRRRMANDN